MRMGLDVQITILPGFLPLCFGSARCVGLVHADYFLIECACSPVYLTCSVLPVAGLFVVDTAPTL